MVVVGVHDERLLAPHEPRGLAVTEPLRRLGESEAEAAKAQQRATHTLILPRASGSRTCTQGRRREASTVLLIDAANVVGSRPTGWWRDRAAAARTFAEQVRLAVAEGRLQEPVVMVLEGAARQGMAEGVADGVEIVHATGEGDETIVGLAAGSAEPVVLVSADRALGDRVRGVGGTVVGPTWLLDRLVS
jgi:hypothetical protein